MCPSNRCRGLRKRSHAAADRAVHVPGGDAGRGVQFVARDLLPKFYARGGFDPAWTDRGKIDQLYELADLAFREGLDKRDYMLDTLSSLLPAQGLPQDIANRMDVDLLATEIFIRIGYQLRFGKLDPHKLFKDWNFDRELEAGVDPLKTIQAAIESPSLVEFVARYMERGPLYRRLVQTLAEYRAIERQGGWGEIPAGPAIREGDEGDRVRLLGNRLSVTGDFGSDDDGNPGAVFDRAMKNAVEAFQARHALEADGIAGRKTLAALNVPVDHRIDQLRASLERGRWIFDSYRTTPDFILVNIAAARTTFVRNHEFIWDALVQIGKPYRQTPVFRGQLEYVVINPTWTVPPTILRKDILPRLKEDALAYLRDKDMEVLDRSGNAVEPSSIDWSKVLSGSFPYTLRQRPGPNNALGRIKFIFPNSHFVFLHDTPHRDLFERASRAFSSGCVRVENPFVLAELVLDDPGKWNASTFEQVLARKRTRTVHLAKPLPVFLLYWTAMVTPGGSVQFFDDVYGRDALELEALARPPSIDLPPGKL